MPPRSLFVMSTFLVDYVPPTRGQNFSRSPSAEQLAKVQENLSNFSALNSGDLGANLSGLYDTGKAVLERFQGHGTEYGFGGAGAPGASGSPFTVRDGKVDFSDPNRSAAMSMVQQVVDANNAWSAEQAQKQMDFQKLMSDTAHQREVQDLIAAGLNPVLSAGGNGAQAMSGAMATPDTANSQAVTQLALGALDAIGNTAVGVAGATGKGGTGSFWNNYYVRRALGGAAGAAGYLVGRTAAGKAVKLVSKLL